MKKLFAAVLALVMALSLTTLAFATDPSTDGGGEEEVEITIPVNKILNITDKTPGAVIFNLKLTGNDGQAIVLPDGGGIAVTPLRVNGTQVTAGSIIIRGSVDSVRRTFIETGFIVQEVNDTADGWSYDNTAWHVTIRDKATGYALSSEDDSCPIEAVAWHGEFVGDEFIAYDQMPSPSISFTNTYTKSSTPRYYYNSTTTTTEPTSSPKTFDAGIALYAALSLTSLTGMAALGRKKF